MENSYSIPIDQKFYGCTIEQIKHDCKDKEEILVLFTNHKEKGTEYYVKPFNPNVDDNSSPFVRNQQQFIAGLDKEYQSYASNLNKYMKNIMCLYCALQYLSHPEVQKLINDTHIEKVLICIPDDSDSIVSRISGRNMKGKKCKKDTYYYIIQNILRQYASIIDWGKCTICPLTLDEIREEC